MAHGSSDEAESAHRRLSDALARKRLNRQVDVVLGEIRVVINEAGLMGLYRDEESLTLVKGEALALARVISEHFGR